MHVKTSATGLARSIRPGLLPREAVATLIEVEAQSTASARFSTGKATASSPANCPFGDIHASFCPSALAISDYGNRDLACTYAVFARSRPPARRGRSSHFFLSASKYKGESGFGGEHLVWAPLLSPGLGADAWAGRDTGWQAKRHLSHISFRRIRGAGRSSAGLWRRSLS